MHVSHVGVLLKSRFWFSRIRWGQRCYISSKFPGVGSAARPCRIVRRWINTRASQVVPVVKNPPANTRDAGMILGSGRCPGGGNSLQYSCLENPHGQSHKELGMADRLSKTDTAHTCTHTHTHTHTPEIIGLKLLNYYKHFLMILWLRNLAWTQVEVAMVVLNGRCHVASVIHLRPCGLSAP